MELPTEIWSEIVNYSKKSPTDLIKEINDLTELEKLKKIIENKILVESYNVAQKYNKFDILYDDIDYWIITDTPNSKLCKIRKAVKTEISGVFGKWNIIEEDEFNIVRGILNKSKSTTNSAEFFTITKQNYNYYSTDSSILQVRKCRVIHRIKELEQIRISYANSLKTGDTFSHNHISTADYRQAHYFNHSSTATEHIRTTKVYYTTDKYIYINPRVRIDKRFIIEK